ncbi:MAG: hypothetical protein QXP04_02670 [Candidatus Nanoarchaeia archaeon]|nr:hypothetical protein [Candidatus Jingweiarchaeum tengchongense]
MLNKAQMSIIDLLFLIIIFSILILMISYSYEKELSEKVADVYNNNYNQLMLISLLSYKSIYNKQAKVCLKEITLSSIDIELPCSEKTQILLGTWPNSLNVKEEC